MLKEFKPVSRLTVIPLSACIRSSMDAFRLDLKLFFKSKQDGELFRRRNCFIKCTSVLLRDSLIYEAFENTRILFLDWLGQHLDSNIVEESLLPQLEKLGTIPPLKRLDTPK